MDQLNSTAKRLLQKTYKPQPLALDLTAILLLTVLCASWGLQQITIKIAISGVSPIFQAAIRSWGATVLVFLWMLFRGKKITARDGTLGWGILVGLIFSIEFMLIYWGLEYTAASRAVIFFNTMPLFVALGAYLFLPVERLRFIQIIGLFCAFAGIVIAFSESVTHTDRQILLGDSMLLVAGALWAMATIIVKASPLANISPEKTLLYQLAVSALFLPLISLGLNEPGVYRLTPLIIACLVYQVVWVAFITYIVWFWLINNYPATRLSSFIFLTPLLGVIEGAVLLDETLSLRLIIALVMVCIGIYVVNRPNHSS